MQHLLISQFKIKKRILLLSAYETLCVCPNTPMGSILFGIRLGSLSLDYGPSQQEDLETTTNNQTPKNLTKDQSNHTLEMGTAQLCNWTKKR